MNSAHIIHRLELLRCWGPRMAPGELSFVDPAYREAIDWVLPDLTLIGPAAGAQLHALVSGEELR